MPYLPRLLFFVALLAIQIVLGGIILYFAYRYQKKGICTDHKE